MRRTLLSLVAMIALHCSPPESDLDQVAERYVRLVLALGQHDPNVVDAYYGPEEWKTAAAEESLPLTDIVARAKDLTNTLEKLEKPSDGKTSRRKEFLLRQIVALEAWANHLTGVSRSFDEESELLFDATAPMYDAAHFEALLGELDEVLPGKGSLLERWESFRSGFVIPPEKLDTVFRTAVNECRRRTLAKIPLPQEESFVIEYVTGKSWSGYNWYKGGAQSLIQVNTDLPISIDRAVDLAAHEGYPGHHVYNVLLETRLLRENGWKEFSIYPLFSPQSLIAEGSANVGIDVVLPGEERIAFERDVLFPLAGIDPAAAADYYRLLSVVNKLSYAGNEAARAYLNGQWTREQATSWLVTYGLYSEDRAEQRLRFIETYRSYVINYNHGMDLVREYVERKAGTAPHPDTRWSVFADLLSSPTLPSSLRRDGVGTP